MKFIKEITRIVMLCSIAILFGNTCKAQINKGHISIQGKITGDYDSIKVRYSTNFEEQHNIFFRGKTKIYPVSGGNFDIKIDSADGLFYMLFYPLDNMELFKNQTYGLLTSSPILVWPGMEISVEITDDSVLVTGKDAMIINFEMDLRRLEIKPSDRKHVLFEKFDIFHGKQEDPYNRMWNYLVGYHQIINETLEQGKKLFESYSINANATAWKQVWYDWVGKMKFNQLNNLHFLHQQYSKNYNPAIEDFYKQYILQEDDSTLIADYRCNSYMFPHYLYYKSYSDLIFLLAQSGVDLNPTFGNLLDLLSARFKSELFEQVAYSAILRQSANKDIDENTYLKLISRLENPEYKFSVENMLTRKTKNRSGYPFILQDNNGKVFTPEDLRGKTVIMDFWYTGCHGCKGLYLHMKSIKSSLSTDSNVVFLSINVDKTRKGWLETVSDPQNGYTDSTNINVWIGNDNKQNSMIRYYDIYSYPTLIILNGNNKILTYNPAYKADIEKKALIALIKESLVK